MAGPYAKREVFYATSLQKMKNPKTYQDTLKITCVAQKNCLPALSPSRPMDLDFSGQKNETRGAAERWRSELGPIRAVVRYTRAGVWDIGQRAPQEVPPPQRRRLSSSLRPPARE